MYYLMFTSSVLVILLCTVVRAQTNNNINVFQLLLYADQDIRESEEYRERFSSSLLCRMIEHNMNICIAALD
jgi:hypothetical protein